MKKLLAILMAMSILVALMGCGNSGDKASDPQKNSADSSADNTSQNQKKPEPKDELENIKDHIDEGEKVAEDISGTKKELDALKKTQTWLEKNAEILEKITELEDDGSIPPDKAKEYRDAIMEILKSIDGAITSN